LIAGDRILFNDGRTLNIFTIGNTVREAQQRAYVSIDRIIDRIEFSDAMSVGAHSKAKIANTIFFAFRPVHVHVIATSIAVRL
jgi:hypothetical protein